MPRPFKCRRVAFEPDITYFKPAGVPLRFLEEVRLSVDELEAIRLKDLEGLEQEDCAKKMNVSRPTFQRVLGSARRKIADALSAGKALRIEGGNFELSVPRYSCAAGHEWEVPLGTKPVSTIECPVCHTKQVSPIEIGGRQPCEDQCQRQKGQAAG